MSISCMGMRMGPKKEGDRVDRIVAGFNALKTGLDVVVSGWQQSTLVLELRGYLETNNTAPFTKMLEALLDDDDIEITVLCLDFNGLLYISSTGIGALTNILVRARNKGTALYLSRVGEKVVSVLSMLGLSSFFSFLDSPDRLLS